ncbi:MAG: polysaccharide deacetylase family protein [Pseudomonadota bacterium]
MPALVSFTIDNLGDAADLHRNIIQTPRSAGSNPALEQGYPALMDLFTRMNISATCFVEGWSARQYPDYVRHIEALGHQIGMHGWQHEKWATLTENLVTELTLRATDSITAATGKTPLAFRAPGGPNTAFTQQLLQRLGYQIDASFSESTGLKFIGGSLVSIPYQWSGVDATHWLWNKRSSDDVDALWKEALLEAAENNRHFVFIWHPHVMGMNPAWLATGARIIRFIQQNSQFQIVPLQAIHDRALQAGPTNILPTN